MEQQRAQQWWNIEWDPYVGSSSEVPLMASLSIGGNALHVQLTPSISFKVPLALLQSFAPTAEDLQWILHFKTNDRWRFLFSSPTDFQQAYARLVLQQQQQQDHLVSERPPPCSNVMVDPPPRQSKVVHPAELMMQRCKMDNSKWRLCRLNEELELSSRLPSILVVPAHTEDRMLQRVASFRSNAMIPYVVYHHPCTQAVLARSSQPLQGSKGRRQVDDEHYLLSLLQSSSGAAPIVVDTRSKAAAQQARLSKAGGGSESEGGNYAGLRLLFSNLDDVATIRVAYGKLMEVLMNKDVSVSTFLHESLPWIKLVQSCLRPAIFVANSIYGDKLSCLIHCDEGTDMTCLLVSLVKVILDPFYRTLNGLFVLLEEDWIHAGHAFQSSLTSVQQDKPRAQTPPHPPRTAEAAVSATLASLSSKLESITAGTSPQEGLFFTAATFQHPPSSHSAVTENQKTSSSTSTTTTTTTTSQISVIFLLFLEAMQQIMNQFPLEFEFNTEALGFIYFHSLSMEFDEFAFANARERRKAAETLSLWSMMDLHRSLFTTPVYRHPTPPSMDSTPPPPPLPVSVNSKRLQLCSGFYDPWDRRSTLSAFHRFKWMLPRQLSGVSTLDEIYVQIGVPSVVANLSEPQRLFAASSTQATVRQFKAEIKWLHEEATRHCAAVRQWTNPSRPLKDEHCEKCGPLCMCSMEINHKD